MSHSATGLNLTATCWQFFAISGVACAPSWITGIPVTAQDGGPCHARA
jgi:hypothetical protein